MLLGLAGGGKRGRSTSLMSADKALLLNTPLDLLIARLPVTDNTISNDVVKELLKLKSAMDTKSDDFVKTTLKMINVVEITNLVDTAKKLQLCERVSHKLAKYFIKELDELLKFVDNMMQVVECMETIFMIRLVKSYWDDSRGDGEPRAKKKNKGKREKQRTGKQENKKQRRRSCLWSVTR